MQPFTNKIQTGFTFSGGVHQEDWPSNPNLRPRARPAVPISEFQVERRSAVLIQIDISQGNSVPKIIEHYPGIANQLELSYKLITDRSLGTEKIGLFDRLLEVYGIPVGDRRILNFRIHHLYTKQVGPLKIIQDIYNIKGNRQFRIYYENDITWQMIKQIYFSPQRSQPAPRPDANSEKGKPLQNERRKEKEDYFDYDHEDSFGNPIPLPKRTARQETALRKELDQELERIYERNHRSN
jgi:hypothetical protein